MKPEGAVDIRDLTWYEHSRVQASETLLLQGQPVDLEVASITYAPTVKGMDGNDPCGRRTMFGVFASYGHHRLLIQLLDRPAQYTAAGDVWGRVEVGREKRILELLGQQATTQLVTAAPEAFQTDETIYESTAPGIQLARAFDVVAKALERGELSSQEASLILTKFNISARLALQALHDRGVKHNHPHPRNFNVDIRTGDLKIFDYTFAVSKYAPDTVFELDQGPVTADNMDEDDKEFVGEWLCYAQLAGLSWVPLLQDFDPSAMAAALAKLEPTVIRGVLHDLGVTNVTDQDVQQVQAAQARVISAMPEVYYPKDTRMQRLRHRATVARTFLREMVGSS